MQLDTANISGHGGSFRSRSSRNARIDRTGCNVILADVAETPPSKLGADYAAVATLYSLRCHTA